jgi:glycosyltransferase involved in cell wall biosynthesis
MNSPRASVIISSYNYDRFLPAAIDGALSQTHPNTQVLVVDDGSVDGSLEVIAGYGGRIKSLLKANGGQASSLNAGFAHCDGDVILFVDSDDVLLPTAVATAVRCFEDPAVVMVHWPMWIIDRDGRQTDKLIPRQPLADGDVRENLVRYGPDSYVTPPTSGNAWGRKFLSNILPMPEPEYLTCPDGYLRDLAPLFGRIKAVAEPQALYRVHGNNNMGRIFYKEKKKRHGHRCAVLQQFLEKEGTIVDPAVWKQAYYNWLHRIEEFERDLSGRIPQGATFILVDEDQIRAEFAAGRNALPFLEREGNYWGPPADDELAIRELERLRAAGAEFIAFAWPAFWWLDHYRGMAEHLRGRFRCVLENGHLILFELSTGSGPQTKPPLREGHAKGAST